MRDRLRYLLVQVRNHDDPMREHEVRCFARVLGCDAAHVPVVDLLNGRPSRGRLDECDVVLLGGSGDYSVAKGGPWLESALESMRELYEIGKPTFASCWGFQAMAAAMGGDVVTDLGRAEVGTYEVQVTPEGEKDPVFGPLAPSFQGQLGHQDVVDRLPEGATLLARTERANQAFRFDGKPIYCTQFHPELNRSALLDRLRKYPEYVQKIAGIPYDQFVTARTGETIDSEGLLRRFVDLVFEPPRTGEGL